MTAVRQPDLGRWSPLTPGEAFALFRALPAPWWLAGGWALDLFVGRQTRDHADLDIEVLRRDQFAIQRHLAGWDLQTAANGALRPWPPGVALDDGVNSIWCRPAPGAPWAMQIMFASSSGDEWCYRRQPTIARPLGSLGLMTAEGLAYLAPEVQLLYKSRTPRAKDDADFGLVLPLLGTARARWLLAALREAHPEQHWIPQLAAYVAASDD